MDTDKSTLDFSSVDTSLLRSPNDISSFHDSMDSDEYREGDLHIPSSSDDVPKADKKSSYVDIKVIQALMTDAFEKAGIAVTEHCTTTVTALSHSLEVEPHSMDWFAAGIIYANNSLIVEKMVSLIKDMQVEVRSLQVASASVKDTSNEFLGKLNKNKKEMLDEMNKTKEAVLQATREISSFKVWEEEEEDYEDTTAAVQKATHRDGKAPIVENPNPTLSNPSLTKHVSSLSPGELLNKRKKKALLDIGLESHDLTALSPDMIDIILTDETLVKMEEGITASEKEVLFDEIISCLVELDL
ncbi:TPA_asm: P [Conopholis alphacytorhabdovirus 1]|nr:TPA_asm: P [Conopholis alphacytorhabdovirus 1]